jgi:hypothetical protein
VKLKLPRYGELIAGAAGLVLLLSLFLPWYSTDADACALVAGASCPPLPSFTAFQSFVVVDVVFLVVALVALALLVLEATQRTPALAVACATMAFIAGLVAVILAIVRALDPPAVAEGLVTRPPAIAGLLATAVLAGGALLSMRDERVDAGGGATSLPEPIRVPPSGANAGEAAR